MRKYVIGGLVGSILVVVLECVAYCLLRWIVFDRAMMGADAFQRYSFVLEYFYEAGKPVPGSLDELAAIWNASAAGKNDPLVLDNPQPRYRPAGRLSNGPYLVLIEEPASMIARESVNVIYAYPSGERDTQKLVSRQELEVLIRDDDRRREVGARALSQPASRP